MRPILGDAATWAANVLSISLDAVTSTYSGSVMSSAQSFWNRRAARTAFPAHVESGTVIIAGHAKSFTLQSSATRETNTNFV
jgi:hypothetical protein